MSITTKTGDRGETALFSGQRVPKHDIRIEIVGSLDEASAHMGVARASAKATKVRASMLYLQKLIYRINAEVACAHPEQPLDDAVLEEITDMCASLEDVIEMPDEFIMPGASLPSAHIEVCRTVVRRAERIVSRALSDGIELNPVILPVINRMSDLLWLLARFEEQHGQ